MKKPIGLFALEDQYRRLSDLGDQLEVLAEIVDFEAFRPDLVRALKRSDRARGGRPPFDPVMMMKILLIQALNDPSDERVEYMINDRLSFMRFLGIELGGRVPDARTIWLYRDHLTKAGVIDDLFERCNAMIKGKGYLAMGGQLVDATIVNAPKQRMTAEQKQAVKDGKSADEIWDKPAQARQKDTDARWTVKYSKAKQGPDGSKPKGHVDIAIPSFGYKNHIATDRRFGFVRGWAVTSAQKYDGHVLGDVLAENTASDVWADSAYRSKKNEEMLAKRGKVSRIHRKKPKGKPMSEAMRKFNARKSKVRSLVEHVFADQKHRMGLFIRTIGIDRAKTKIGLANIAYNMRRLVFHERVGTLAA